MRILGLSLLLLASVVSAAEPPSAVDRFLTEPSFEKLTALLEIYLEKRATASDWIALRALLQAPEREIPIPELSGDLVSTHDIALYGAELATGHWIYASGPTRFITFRPTTPNIGGYRFHIPNTAEVSAAAKAEAKTIINACLASATLQETIGRIRGIYGR